MTTFIPVHVGLSNGQQKELKSAMDSGQAVSLRLKPENLVGNNKLMLTTTTTTTTTTRHFIFQLDSNPVE